jgi:predicted metal-dependent phosphoesterase TrpH
MIYDLHVHSKYSRDSILSPEKIISVAKRKKLDGVAVTDHNTIRGGLAAFKLNKSRDFEVIVGAEIKTEYDDIIGLFLNEEIKTRTFAGVVDEIHDQGGLCVLAHPYRRYDFPEKLVEHVDLVEGFNARSPNDENNRAFAFAQVFKKPMTAGSDAHLSCEIGRGRTYVDSDAKKSLQKGTTNIRGDISNYYAVHGLSLTIETFKNHLGMDL